MTIKEKYVKNEHLQGAHGENDTKGKYTEERKNREMKKKETAI